MLKIVGFINGNGEAISRYLEAGGR